MGNSAPTRWIAPLVVVAAALLVYGPVLLSRGYVLIGDMTFVPEQPWKGAWLGLDGSAPRAVPADALVSVLTQVVPGDLLQKAILLGILVAAGLGMLRLARELGATGTAAPLAAAILYLWNPYIHERIGIGHWGLLVGYAALPWIAVAAGSLRRGESGATARLCLAVAPAAFGSPTGGLLAGLVVLALLVGPGSAALRRTASGLAVVVVLNLPWLVPGLLGAETGADPAGVDAFAARSDTPLGLWGSVLTFGGIWKQSIVAEERDALLLVLLALAVSLGSLVVLLRHRSPAGVERRLLTLGLGGLLLAAVPGTGLGGDLVADLVAQVPGAGVLRDSQKWAALLALAVAAGFALVVGAVSREVRSRRLPAGWFQVALVALPVVLLPSLAWGLAGKLEPVRYPAEWSAVRTLLEAVPADERSTVVLPFSAYQRLPWNGGRAALDPAIRFFPGQVVTSDELIVAEDLSVLGDSADAARIGEAVRRGAPLAPVLADVGVRFVLVEKTAAGAQSVEVPPGEVLHDGPELTLLDTGNTAATVGAAHPGLIVAGDILAALVLLTAGSLLALRQIQRKSPEIG